jgi:hypothetical protein
VSPNRVYVADTSNNRVLGFKSISALLNGAEADLIIGSSDFFAAGNFGTNEKTLNGPRGVAVDKLGNLYVADTNNNRVLEYNKPFASGLSTNLSAQMVFGQGLNFTSNQCNFGQSSQPNIESLCSPQGVALDSNGNLFVADTNNNRVLAYESPFNPTTDADIVYGQPLFTTNFNNLGGISATSLSGPTAVALDSSNNLYVADSNNNRELSGPAVQRPGWQ